MQKAIQIANSSVFIQWYCNETRVIPTWVYDKNKIFKRTL